MRYCNQCGHHLATEAKFCGACGTAVDGEEGHTVHSGQDSTNSPPSGDQTINNQPSSLKELVYRGVGMRMLAQFFDAIPMFFIFLFAGIAVSAWFDVGRTADGFALEGTPALITILFTVIGGILYFSVLEAIWGGQTLGKKLTKTKVTNLQGEKISFSQALNRNIWRIIDGLFFYLLGAILIWRSPLKQRLGDRMAETVVIKKIKPAVEGNPGKPKKKSRLKFGSDIDMMDLD